MGIFSDVVAWVVATLGPYGVLGLTLVAFTESIFNPVPPDVLLIPLVIETPGDWFFLGLVTTVASVAGAAVGWALGRWSEPLVSRLVRPDRMAQVQALFDRWGAPAIVVAGITPIPYKVFTISAGVFGLAFVPFMLASVVGRGIRFIGVAGLAAWQGPQAVALADRLGGWTAVILVAALVVWLVVRYRPGRDPPTEGPQLE